MPSMNIQSLPELGDDAAIQALIDTFDARIVQAETEHHYIGNLTFRVKVDADNFVTLPTVRLVYACHKAELERARATMFASHLLQQGRETARTLWQQVAPWEGKEFMAWVKQDIEWKRANGGVA